MGKVLSKHRSSKSTKSFEALPSEKQLEPSFTAEGENCKADQVILFEPGLEVFLSCLHPQASLYEKVTTRKKAKESFNNFVEALNKHSITVHNVRDILKLDKAALIELAAKVLIYKDDGITEATENEEEKKEDRAIPDYKMSVLKQLDLDDLIDIIFCQPMVKYSSCEINTGIELDYIKTKPVGNMVFCRDQQITTNKGVVIGHLNSSQREFESEIMKLVFKNLGINFVDNMPKECRLEGGDFIPLNKNLCLLGVGLRTNFKAAQYLMDNDLLGTDRFAVIHDRNDQDQDRMHLDTVFNVINHDTVIVLDFDTVPDQITNINRTVDIYKKNELNEYKIDEENIDFYKFLANEGFKNIIKVTHEQQLKYMINFLNIGDGNIIAVNEDLEGVIDDFFDKKHKINVEYVEFDGIKAMYGAAHCATQVSRVPTSAQRSYVRRQRRI